MRYQLLIIILLAVYSCKKLSTKPAPDVAVDYYVSLSAKVLLRDKISDSILLGERIKYNEDSVQVWYSDDNISFRKWQDIFLYNYNEFPFGLPLPYFRSYVNPDTQVEHLRFTKYYAIKWNPTETDSLKVVKDTDHEIRFYTNGKHYKTIPSKDKAIPEITFYR